VQAGCRVEVGVVACSSVKAVLEGECVVQYRLWPCPWVGGGPLTGCAWTHVFRHAKDTCEPHSRQRHL